MKKLLCFLLCLTLIFSSVSLSFAAQDVSDATTHTQLGNIYNLLNGTNISGRLANIYNKLTDINANIVTLMGWLDPSTGGSTNALLQKIVSAITYVTENSTLGSFIADLWQLNAVYLPELNNLPYLNDLKIALTNTDPGIHSNFNSAYAYTHAHSQMFGRTYDNNTGDVTTLRYFMPAVSANGGQTAVGSYWTNGSPIGNIAQMLQLHMQNQVRSYVYTWGAELNGYNSSQSARNWLTLSGASFTPTSAINGIYTWLKRIQDPTARLAYVLANDQEIEARDAAADNQQAVVDNFIDSTGDGASSPSDIGSVSDLSSGYKQNFGTDASPSGIFDIFNADHASWFSQETKNQLDTTTPTRLTKGSKSETPLLDKQIEDIYNALGVKQP